MRKYARNYDAWRAPISKIAAMMSRLAFTTSSLCRSMEVRLTSEAGTPYDVMSRFPAIW